MEEIMRNFFARLFCPVITVFAVLFAISCQTVEPGVSATVPVSESAGSVFPQNPEPSEPVYTQDIEIGDAVYPIKINSVGKDNGSLIITIESEKENFIPEYNGERINDLNAFLDRYSTNIQESNREETDDLPALLQYLSDLKNDMEKMGGFFDFSDFLDQNLPKISISGNGEYFDGELLNIKDGKITYSFNTNSVPEMVFVYSPERYEDLSGYKAFILGSDSETPDSDPDQFSAAAVDFFVGPDEGIDIYELYNNKKIGLEIIGVDSYGDLLLNIWRTTDEDITVKIDYGTWFSTEGAGSPVETNFEYRETERNIFNVNFVTSVNYSPVLVRAGGGVQDMAARKRYSFKMSRALENNLNLLRSLRDRNISIYPNSGIFLASSVELDNQPYKYTIKIPVVCIDYEKETPRSNNIFTPQPKLITPGFVSLLQKLDEKKASGLVSQHAVWLFRGGQERALDNETPDKIIKYAEIWVNDSEIESEASLEVARIYLPEMYNDLRYIDLQLKILNKLPRKVDSDDIFLELEIAKASLKRDISLIVHEKYRLLKLDTIIEILTEPLAN
jgi:hypothetical protein